MFPLDQPEFFRSVLESLQTGVYVVNREQRIVFWNDGAERLSGYLRQEVLGRFGREDILIHCSELACTEYHGDNVAPAIGPLPSVGGELRMFLRHKAGHRVPVIVRAVAVRDHRGHVVGTAESVEAQNHDDDRRQHHLAQYGCLDPETNFPKPGFTEFQLREQLAFFAQHHVPFGVLLITVEDLAGLHARHGEEACRRVMHEEAETVHGVLDPGDFLGRWSENTLLAILPEMDAGELELLSCRMRNLSAWASIEWWGDPLAARVSVGAALVQTADTVEQLLARAEAHRRSAPGPAGPAPSHQHCDPQKG
jgi:PAS domain S-box-containing protein